MFRLFNTASRRIEQLEFPGDRASLYVCGVTPYDTTHLGHAFTYVMFDVLARYLRSVGVDVSYTQNVTDIDDDILRKAKERGLPYDELAARETAQFLRDMDDLSVIRPDSYVPATSMMPEIVASVRKLLDHGLAYVSEGNVYFANNAFPEYGSIAHVGRDELIRLAAEHGGFPDDPRKRDPLDFLLWQAHVSGEPEWPSPFGPGRPGWHIECSTIASVTLRVPLDIHGGGMDLIFPHHASEIAEAESSLDIHPFVRLWMHTAMVRMDGEKMSKSLGNMVFIRDLLTRYSSDAIRLYLLSHHYREPFEWDERELERASELAAVLSRFATAAPQKVDGDQPAPHSFEAAMADDFRTPAVIEELFQMSVDPASADIRTVVAWSRSVLGLQLASTAAPLSMSEA